MKNKTKKAYEAHLNELYEQTCYDYCTAISEFDYMTVKSRGRHTTRANIINHYNKQQLGALLRKYDPIAFNVGLNEWSGN